MPGFAGSWNIFCRNRLLSHKWKLSGQRSSTHPAPEAMVREGLGCARGLAFRLGEGGENNPPEEGCEGCRWRKKRHPDKKS